jgi:hypothetical protein
MPQGIMPDSARQEGSETTYGLINSTGHAHIGSNLGDRKRFTVHVTNRHACSNEESFYARAEGLADWRVSAMHSSHDIDH